MGVNAAHSNCYVTVTLYKCLYFVFIHFSLIFIKLILLYIFVVLKDNGTMKNLALNSNINFDVVAYNAMK